MGQKEKGRRTKGRSDIICIILAVISIVIRELSIADDDVPKSVYTPTDVRTYVRTDCVGTHSRTYGLRTVKTENFSYQSESHCTQLISIR